MGSEPIKQCSFCRAWLSAEDILINPDIVPLGMAFGQGETFEAYYYFVHNVSNCGTTLLIPVTALRRAITENIPSQLLVGTDSCERHCVSLDDLAVCQQDCANAPYRRLLLKMMEIKRQGARASR